MERARKFPILEAIMCIAAFGIVAFAIMYAHPTSSPGETARGGNGHDVATVDAASKGYSLSSVPQGAPK